MSTIKIMSPKFVAMRQKPNFEKRSKNGVRKR
jgi:hypothetical protein